MNRAAVLDTAKEYVTRDRQADHGRPEDTFGVIADYWTAYLTRAHGLQSAVMPSDVANLMILLKIARASQNSLHADNYVDMAGYSSIAAELAGAE